MNNTFKKRIDELGRIVIPKQIRNTFKINDFDELELYIENNNIILKKTGGILVFKEKLDRFLDFLSKYNNIKMFILDKDTVISSNIEGINCNNKLDFDTSKYINNQEYSTINNNDISLQGYIRCFQIIIDSNLYGYIVFVLDESNKNYSKELHDIVNIIIDLIN